MSPNPVLNGDGSIRQPGLDNHAMGTVFEELVRRFNEDNNEEAGEHWAPHDAVKLMARLIFLPIAEEIESGTYLLYDGACGTGGMLTVAEETLQELTATHGKQVATHLYGQEINAETYAICKADLLLKGEGDQADNIIGGPEHSTLSNDAFPAHEFDFMLSNPPYGKSWKSDLERLGGKQGIKDPRFVIEHAGNPEYSLITRSSDGQMLFLANLLSKMKHGTRMGSRLAEVHNGSSLFTGDAGQGECNIRRWIIENDWLEAIVALPLNMFYNTGIATYIWVIGNRKPAHRKGKVQLIDATRWYQPLRKNLGKKNCELSEDDIRRICDTFLAFEETEQSKIFPNEAFGYWKVTVERPLRLKGIDPNRAYKPAEIRKLKETAERAEFVTLLEVHKLMYFMQVAGEPLKLNYQQGVYGPYAENLRHVLNAIEGHLVSGYADGGDAPDKQLKLVPGALEDADAFLRNKADTRNRFEKVSDLVEGFESSFGLELLSTVHWIASTEQVRSVDEMVARVYAWNDRKKQFSPRQIALVADQLSQKDWIDSLGASNQA